MNNVTVSAKFSFERYEFSVGRVFCVRAMVANELRLYMTTMRLSSTIYIILSR